MATKKLPKILSEELSLSSSSLSVCDLLGHVDGDHLSLSRLSGICFLKGHGRGGNGASKSFLLNVKQTLFSLDSSQGQGIHIVQHSEDDGSKTKNTTSSKVSILQNLELGFTHSIAWTVRVKLSHARKVKHDDRNNEEKMCKDQVNSSVECSSANPQAKDNVAAFVCTRYGGDIASN